MTTPLDATFIDPVTVSMLIVADGRLRFVENAARENGGFCLSRFIEALQEKTGPIVRFSTVTAYRQPQQHIRTEAEDSIGEGADFRDFHFALELQETTDEVWFFGDQGESLNTLHEPIVPTTQLKNDEPGVLQRFMDNGGGVFATGDHLSLGASMSVRLPRVAVMRHWNNLRPGIDSNRNDTTSGALDLREESDEIPQTIHPRFYGRLDFPVYSHPLLCMPRGTVSVLPDHMHEGECREDQSDLELEEFGTTKPLVVADSDNHAGTPGRFGAIGAYDGHLANKGRIVVDSTFHHFINPGLRGFVEELGGLTTRADRGAYAYEDIKNYYRNAAIWLAPPRKQREMFMRAIWEARWRSRVYGLVAPETGLIDPGAINPATDFNNVLRVGRDARAALEQLISSAFTLLWSVEVFKGITGNDPDVGSLYPWLRENQRAGPTADPTAKKAEQVIDFLLGGVMIALALRFPRKPAESVPDLAGELEASVSSGVQIGVAAFRASAIQ